MADRFVVFRDSYGSLPWHVKDIKASLDEGRCVLASGPPEVYQGLLISGRRCWRLKREAVAALDWLNAAPDA
jgi:hypothetical protein